MRADNWRKLICMHKGADIYLNLIYFPHCRLLCQSHINPLISWYAAHDVAHARWIFISELPFSRVPAPVPSPPCTRPDRPWSSFFPPSSCAQTRAFWLLPVSASLAPLTRMAHESEPPGKERALRGRHEAMAVAGKRTHVQKNGIRSYGRWQSARGVNVTAKQESPRDEIKLWVYFIEWSSVINDTNWSLENQPRRRIRLVSGEESDDNQPLVKQKCTQTTKPPQLSTGHFILAAACMSRAHYCILCTLPQIHSFILLLSAASSYLK